MQSPRRLPLGISDEVKSEVVVTFVTLQPGNEPNEVLRRELNEQLVISMGKPLAPKAIRFVGDFPNTRNVKVMQRAVQAVYLGQDPGDLSALVTPEVICE